MTYHRGTRIHLIGRPLSDWCRPNMKNKFRFLTTVFIGFACYANSFATGLIVRVTDPNLVSSILADFPVILDVDQAGHSPFFRIEVDDDLASSLEASLVNDSRIVWVESEAFSKDLIFQSSHGSSVAAIFDRSASYPRNDRVKEQIGFSQNVVGRASLRVGIVDTGLSPLQPLLYLKVIAGQSFVEGSPSIDDLPSNCDSNLNGILDEGAGHGTMVAGIILQTAPNCQLVVAKSADSDGNATPWSVLKGVVFCVENHAKLINLSLGSAQPLTGFGPFVDWVEDNGSLIIAPIGNKGQNKTLFPAGYSNVVCVTGLLSDNTKAPFSNWAPCARVAAPATGILGEWYTGSMAKWSGTSFAAPMVTGSLAAAIANNPRRTPMFLRFALDATGVEIDGPNPAYQGQLGKLLNFTALQEFLR